MPFSMFVVPDAIRLFIVHFGAFMFGNLATTIHISYKFLLFEVKK